MSFRIAVVVGSLRAESFNRRVANAITRLPAGQGTTFTFADIGALPLYDQDQDNNPAPSVVALKALIENADGVLFVTPEYNRSIPGVLKNAIDHASRPYGRSVWNGKPAGVLGVSPGAIGTALAQQHLRGILAYLNMPTVNEPELFIQWSDGLIKADGTIGDASSAFLDGWLATFMSLVKLHQK